VLEPLTSEDRVGGGPLLNTSGSTVLHPTNHTHNFICVYGLSIPFQSPPPSGEQLLVWVWTRRISHFHPPPLSTLLYGCLPWGPFQVILNLPPPNISYSYPRRRLLEETREEVPTLQGLSTWEGLLVVPSSHEQFLISLFINFFSTQKRPRGRRRRDFMGPYLIGRVLYTRTVCVFIFKFWIE